ncbi:MAG TPA: hypothetical protein VHA11_03875 [Bryobacteraceae bacterium]|nr:hypothetical protein [Bryobacteraceae bacterium]
MVVAEQQDGVDPGDHQVEPAVVVVIGPGRAHAQDAQIGEASRPLEGAVAAIVKEHGRRACGLRRVQRASGAGQEQVVEAVVVEVSPRRAAAHIFGQLRSAGAGEGAKRAQSRFPGDIGKARRRRSWWQRPAGIAKSIAAAGARRLERRTPALAGFARILLLLDGARDVGGGLTGLIFLRLAIPVNLPCDQAADERGSGQQARRPQHAPVPAAEAPAARRRRFDELADHGATRTSAAAEAISTTGAVTPEFAPST